MIVILPSPHSLAFKCSGAKQLCCSGLCVRALADDHGGCVAFSLVGVWVRPRGRRWRRICGLLSRTQLELAAASHSDQKLQILEPSPVYKCQTDTPDEGKRIRVSIDCKEGGLHHLRPVGRISENDRLWIYGSPVSDPENKAKARSSIVECIRAYGKKREYECGKHHLKNEEGGHTSELAKTMLLDGVTRFRWLQCSFSHSSTQHLNVAVLAQYSANQVMQAHCGHDDTLHMTTSLQLQCGVDGKPSFKCLSFWVFRSMRARPTLDIGQA
ncbi:unnamed protein product [Somion occarium]|uniref:Uncharacterized protein n=1 Tax=Somion occarium TaxID=3059160 RepID=A0ABP1D3F2_9APHY